MIKQMRLLAGAIAMVILAACAGMGAPAAMGTAEDDAAIRALGTRYAEAYNAKDAAALAQLATEDYDALGPDGVRVTGRAAFQQMAAAEFTAMPAGMNLTLNVTTDFVRWMGAENATAGGTFTVAGLPPGMSGDRGAWLTVVHKDADGQWRMAGGLVSAFIPPPPPPDTTTVP